MISLKKGTVVGALTASTFLVGLAGIARAHPHSVRIEANAAPMLTEPQATVFAVGRGGAVAFEYRHNAYLGLDVRFSAQGWGLARNGDREGYGTYFAPALGGRIHPLAGLLDEQTDLYFEGSVAPVLTGRQLRPGIDLGAGAVFGLLRGLGVGPVVRYAHTIETSTGPNGGSAGFVQLGVAVVATELLFERSRPVEPVEPAEVLAVAMPPKVALEPSPSPPAVPAPESAPALEPVPGPAPEPQRAAEPALAPEDEPAPAPDSKNAPEPAPASEPVPQPEPERASVPDPLPASAAELVSAQEPEPIAFAFGQHVLSESSMSAVDEVFRQLNARHGVSRVLIAGHTDESGPRAVNLDLSRRRAVAVARRLIGLGFASDRIDLWGCGELSPRLPNATKLGRRQNQRAELRLLDGESSRPDLHPGCVRIPVD